MKRYIVHHRPTKSRAYVKAESAQEACEFMDWLIGDCYVEVEGRKGVPRKNAEPSLRVETVNYGGYRVYNWHLVLPGTKRLPETLMYLGQDAKVCIRLLGIEPHALAALMKKRFGKAEILDPDVNFCIARMIVDKAGGLRACRKLEPWELAVQ